MRVLFAAGGAEIAFHLANPLVAVVGQSHHVLGAEGVLEQVNRPAEEEVVQIDYLIHGVAAAVPDPDLRLRGDGGIDEMFDESLLRTFRRIDTTLGTVVVVAADKVIVLQIGGLLGDHREGIVLAHQGLAYVEAADVDPAFTDDGVEDELVGRLIAIVIDFLAAAFGAKRSGASPRAFGGATLGAVAGIFFGLPGIILGPFIGAVAAELSAGHGTRQAGRSGYGVWVGLILGTAAKLSIAFLMLGIFLMKYIFAWYSAV